jgi:hypothetical protein
MGKRNRDRDYAERAKARHRAGRDGSADQGDGMARRRNGAASSKRTAARFAFGKRATAARV